MPTSRTTTETWQDSTTEQSQQSQQSGFQQLTAAPQSNLERLLQDLAGQLYMQSAGEAAAGYGVNAQQVMAGGVSADQRQMVADWQNSTLAASQASMQGLFDEQMGNISNQMAARGILNSTATGAAYGMAQRDLQRQFGSMAAQTQAQAAQQLLGLSQGGQQIGLQLLGMQNQARQWASNPQLLQDLIQYRLATGRVETGGTASGTSLQDVTGYAKEISKQRQPTDWASIIGNLAQVAGAARGGK